MKEEPARVDEFGQNRAFSRRRMLGLSAAGLITAAGASLAACAAPGTARAGRAPHVAPPSGPPQPVTAPPPDGVLGANFNGDPAVMSYPELQAIEATWVRGFFAMPDADHGNPADQPAIGALLAAAAQGYGTVLSLKFPYADQPIPTPGGAEMAVAQRRLDAVLPVVMNKVDILAIGNEPFIESRRVDHDDRLNVFYEQMAQRAIAYRTSRFGSGCKTQLYMGALNHLDLPGWRTPATDRWMRFVHATPAIAGTDIHPHLPAPGADQAYLDYILPRLRPDQKFLATEFSLVLFYRAHLTRPISPDFADGYHLPRGMPTWQVIKKALERPFPQQQWDDFFTTTPWLAENKNYLTDQVDRFRATGKLAVATYGIGQDTAMSSHTFGPDSPPWVLNSMFCQHTVQPAPNGLPGRNTWWTDEFRALQHG